MHGRGRVATWVSCPPPWNLKIVTLNAVSVQNTLNFSLAHLTLASDTFKFSLKTSKKSKYFVCAFGSLKVGSFLPVHAVLPPLKKFLRAPMVQCQSCTKYSPALVASSRAKAATNTISHNHQDGVERVNMCLAGLFDSHIHYQLEVQVVSIANCNFSCK